MDQVSNFEQNKNGGKKEVNRKTDIVISYISNDEGERLHYLVYIDHEKEKKTSYSISENTYIDILDFLIKKMEKALIKHEE